MAPAAADVIYQNLKDFDRKPTYYDRIITGDLGKIGQKILFDLFKGQWNRYQQPAYGLWYRDL